MLKLMALSHTFPPTLSCEQQPRRNQGASTCPPSSANRNTTQWRMSWIAQHLLLPPCLASPLHLIPPLPHCHSYLSQIHPHACTPHCQMNPQFSTLKQLWQKSLPSPNRFFRPQKSKSPPLPHSKTNAECCCRRSTWGFSGGSLGLGASTWTLCSRNVRTVPIVQQESRYMDTVSLSIIQNVKVTQTLKPSSSLPLLRIGSTLTSPFLLIPPSSGPDRLKLIMLEDITPHCFLSLSFYPLTWGTSSLLVLLTQQICWDTIRLAIQSSFKPVVVLSTFPLPQYLSAFVRQLGMCQYRHTHQSNLYIFQSSPHGEA